MTDHPSVTVRRALPADVDVLAPFAARAFRATYGPDAPPTEGGGSRPVDVDAYVEAHLRPTDFAEDLEDPALVTFVAEAGPGGLAGYAQLRLPPAMLPATAPTPGASVAELTRLYVDHPWKGYGVAAVLLDAVRAAAARAGAAALCLAVYQRNARAVAFYQRQGFAIAGTAAFRMGAEVQADWVMLLPLHAP